MRAVLIRQIKNKWVEITFEIYDLALAAGYEIVEEVIYHNNKPHPVHYISQSKLQDLLYLIPTFDIEKIIVDDVLSIKHFNALEKETEIKVLENINPSILSKLHNIARINTQNWNSDGTANIVGVMPKIIYEQNKRMLGVE